MRLNRASGLKVSASGIGSITVSGFRCRAVSKKEFGIVLFRGWRHQTFSQQNTQVREDQRKTKGHRASVAAFPPNHQQTSTASTATPAKRAVLTIIKDDI